MPATSLSTYRPQRNYTVPVRTFPHASIEQVSTRNHILTALPANVLERISPHLELIEFEQGTVIYETGAPITYIYFPVNAIISLLHMMENGDTAQTAMVGPEGMAGVWAFMGCQYSPSRATMQVSGQVLKLPAHLLTYEFKHNPQAMQTLLRYTQTLFIQFSQTAVCNRHHSIEKQVCRWLLTTLDRRPVRTLFVTHELIARMLGVRREGVTEAMRNLQQLGVVVCRRGQVLVNDRRMLEQHVCECYATVQEQTQKLVVSSIN